MTTRDLRVVVLAVVMGAPASGAAETHWLEAEIPRDDTGMGGNITSPLVVRDHYAASGGSWVEVEAGNNNKTQPPPPSGRPPGQACVGVEITETGPYRVWARVMAPTDGDDSFWFRMDSDPWINWNQIQPGGTWHWDFVHDNTNPAEPTLFTLSEGDHGFCFGYREDGTKVDVFVVTNDPAFDPNTAPVGPPPAPAQIDATAGKNVVMLSWSNVPGATGYVLERRDAAEGSPFAPRIAVSGALHVANDINVTGEHCYRVVARNAAGAGPATPEVCKASLTELRYVPGFWKVTSTTPMIGGTIAVTPGFNSTSAPPAAGRARLDFRLGSSWRLKVWARAVAPDTSSDSFWVRVDRGAWMNWNNIRPAGPCGWDDVHDSAAGGAGRIFDLAAGSHTVEFAYREDGAEVTRLLLSDDLSGAIPSHCHDEISF